MSDAQGELVLNIEQGTGIGDQQTAEEYARMLATYGVVVVDGITAVCPPMNSRNAYSDMKKNSETRHLFLGAISRTP
jgi:hypothetical protein